MGDPLNIFIDLGNQLLKEALSQLVVRMGDYHVITSGNASNSEIVPNVLLVDGAALRDDLLARYPGAKVLLIDTGMEAVRLSALLLSHRIHGVLSPTTQTHRFKRVLKAMSRGCLWTMDKTPVKTSYHNPGINTGGRTTTITDREREIIACVCKGLTNKEIADGLSLSPCTVRAHLYRIYRKLSVRSRSKLIALTMQRSLARSD